MTQEKSVRWVTSLVALAVLIAGLTARLHAHDIPADTTVRAFIKPDGTRLRFLVRVPMAAINDIDWPVRKGDGTLDLAAVEPFLRDAAGLWIADYVDMFEGSTKLAAPKLTSIRLSLENNAFATYDDAWETLTGPKLPDTTLLLPTQGMLDAQLEYSIQSETSRFSFHPRFDRLGLRVVTILQVRLASGVTRAFEYDRGDPGLIRLDPTALQAALDFGMMGLRHIIDGQDHLLFLLCLVLPLRRVTSLVAVATAFTIAHSVTLIASAYDMAPGALWFPPLVDTLIAVSIVYMAIGNIVTTPSRRWIMSFAFGLIHGFGFAFALRQSLQFAGAHLFTSLVSFNLGLEIGQVAALLVFVPALWMLVRLVPERAAVIVLSGLAAHTAWHWMLDRYGQLSRYRFEAPAIDAAFLAALFRWLMVVVALAFAYWVASVVNQRREGTA